MPNVLVWFSWELEFVDVDNDYDLECVVSCKQCEGGFLFENDGTGSFTDVTQGRLPQFPNNYDFEAMDVNGDDYLDLATTNDGRYPDLLAEHLFLNDRRGGFSNETSRLWPDSENVGSDDAMDTFLDFDSDGDADLLIGSLDDDMGYPDRLLLNHGTGKLKLVNRLLQPILSKHSGNTLYCRGRPQQRLQVLRCPSPGRGAPGSFREKVYLGDKIPT